MPGILCGLSVRHDATFLLYFVQQRFVIVAQAIVEFQVLNDEFVEATEAGNVSR